MQGSFILPAWAANHSAGFVSPCPLLGLAIKDPGGGGGEGII